MNNQLKQDHFKVLPQKKEEEQQYLSGRGAQFNTKNKFLKNQQAKEQLPPGRRQPGRLRQKSAQQKRVWPPGRNHRQKRNRLQRKPRVVARKSSIPLLPADAEVWVLSRVANPAIRRASHAEAMTILKVWKS